MTTEAQQAFDAAVKSSQEAQAAAVALLLLQGETIELSDWVTAKEYARRFGLDSTNVVTNWIRRGIIPAENVKVIKEFNDLRLIRAIPYKETV